jgi:hypothetical protein
MRVKLEIYKTPKEGSADWKRSVLHFRLALKCVGTRVQTLVNLAPLDFALSSSDNLFQARHRLCHGLAARKQFAVRLFLFRRALACSSSKL